MTNSAIQASGAELLVQSLEAQDVNHTRPTIGIAASPVAVVEALAALPDPAPFPDQRRAYIRAARVEFETWTTLPEGIGATRMPEAYRLN